VLCVGESMEWMSVPFVVCCQVVVSGMRADPSSRADLRRDRERESVCVCVSVCVCECHHESSRVTVPRPTKVVELWKKVTSLNTRQQCWLWHSRAFLLSPKCYSYLIRSTCNARSRWLTFLTYIFLSSSRKMLPTLHFHFTDLLFLTLQNPKFHHHPVYIYIYIYIYIYLCVCVYMIITVNIYFPKQNWRTDLYSRTHSVLCEVRSELLHLIFIDFILYSCLLECLGAYAVIILQRILEWTGWQVIDWIILAQNKDTLRNSAYTINFWVTQNSSISWLADELCCCGYKETFLSQKKVWLISWLT
jgi:hypothetical protein